MRLLNEERPLAQLSAARIAQELHRHATLFSITGSSSPVTPMAIPSQPAAPSFFNMRSLLRVAGWGFAASVALGFVAAAAELQRGGSRLASLMNGLGQTS